MPTAAEIVEHAERQRAERTEQVSNALRERREGNDLIG
jgi:hypothetical protein